MIVNRCKVYACATGKFAQAHGFHSMLGEQFSRCFKDSVASKRSGWTRLILGYHRESLLKTRMKQDS